jgi:PAS domain-containing protein
MSQKEIETILMRQLATYLSTPIFIVDGAGTLLFYNEAAELLLGRRFDEAGEMPFEEWTTVFAPLDETGAPAAPESLPLAVAVLKRRPAFGRLTIRGLDGVPRAIAVTAFPLEGQSGRHLGAVAFFWSATTP